MLLNGCIGSTLLFSKTKIISGDYLKMVQPKQIPILSGLSKRFVDSYGKPFLFKRYALVTGGEKSLWFPSWSLGTRGST